MADLSLDDIIASKGLGFRLKTKNDGRKTEGNSLQQLSRKGSSFQQTGLQRLPKKLIMQQNGASSVLVTGPGKGQIDARDMISIRKRIKLSDARTKIIQKRLQSGSFDVRSRLNVKGVQLSMKGSDKFHSISKLEVKGLGAFGMSGTQQPVAVKPVVLRSSPTLQPAQLVPPFLQSPRFQPSQQFYPAFQSATQPFGQQTPIIRQQHLQPASFILQPSLQHTSAEAFNLTVSVNASQSISGTVPPLTRTLINPLAGGGTLVEDMGDSLKITRSVPDVTFDGNNLKVTRRLPSNQNEEPGSLGATDQGLDDVENPIQMDRFRVQPSMPKDEGLNLVLAGQQGIRQESVAVQVMAQGQQKVQPLTRTRQAGPVQNSTPVLQSRYKFQSPSGAVKSGNYQSAGQPKPSSAIKSGNIQTLVQLHPVLAPTQPTLSRLKTQSVFVPNKITAPDESALNRLKTQSVFVPNKITAPDESALNRLAHPPPAALSQTRVKPPVHSSAVAPPFSQTRVAAQIIAPPKLLTKRKLPVSLTDRFSEHAETGNPIPVITDHGPAKKRRPVEQELDVEEEFEMKEQDNSHEESSPTTYLLSPLQGFRLMVTNLHSNVTQEDIIELFGAIGPLKRANLLAQGQAEVAFIHKEHAISAVKKYHGRELDGQAMFVKVITPVNAKVMKTHETTTMLPASLRSSKKLETSSDTTPIDIPLIHKALFQIGTTSSNKSVRFTVKI